MTQYELALILHPDLEIDLEKPVSKIEKFITELDGKIINRDDWGKRKLAYPINKQSFGIYYIYLIDLPASAVNRLEKNLNITDEVIRHLLVKYIEPPVPEDKDEKEKKKAAKKAAKSEDATEKPAEKVAISSKKADDKEEKGDSPAKTSETESDNESKA